MSVPETTPSSGCSYYANGDILCASNCSGSWEGTPGNSPTDTTCNTGGQSGSVSGPGPTGGGSTTTANPFMHGGGFSGSPSPSLTYSQRIYNALQKFVATHSSRNSTLNYGGAPAGNECVSTSQAILAAAGLATIANNTMAVDVFENALQYSGYVEVTQANAQPGDIVIQSQDKHMGFCETDGCNTMISNSSTPESFTWQTSPPNFEASYGAAGPSRFYHHE